MCDETMDMKMQAPNPKDTEFDCKCTPTQVNALRTYTSNVRSAEGWRQEHQERVVQTRCGAARHPAYRRLPEGSEGWRNCCACGPRAFGVSSATVPLHQSCNRDRIRSTHDQAQPVAPL